MYIRYSKENVNTNSITILTEILLKVALNTIKIKTNSIYYTVFRDGEDSTKRNSGTEQVINKGEAKIPRGHNIYKI